MTTQRFYDEDIHAIVCYASVAAQLGFKVKKYTAKPVNGLAYIDIEGDFTKDDEQAIFDMAKELYDRAGYHGV